MNYLYGDSTESGLDFNYLAFLREALDCAVVLVENEATLGSGERKRAKESEAALAIQSIEELGRHAAELFDPVVKAYAESPVGRAAAAITKAVKDVIATESAKVKTALGATLETMSAEDGKLRARTTAVVEKLLRAYELPVAARTYEWDPKTGKHVRITQRTPYGIDAVMETAAPAGSVFATGELRVDKLADNVEIASVEAGGWIKKSDKLVPYKLGRYFVTRVVVGGRDGTQLRLRMTQDANAPGFNLSLVKDELALEKIGDNHEKDAKGRDYTIDERNKPALRALVDKIEAAAKAIGAGENRTLVSVAIDGAPLAEHAHPQVFAERLISAMAPTVREIATHSSNANELVLRRMIGEDRREEIFVAISELTKKLDPVPEAGRSVFAPLGIDRRALPRRSPTQPPQVPIAGIAAITASVAGPDDDPLRRTRATAGPPTRTAPPRPPPPGPGPGAVPEPRAKSTSGPVPLPGLTPPSTSSAGIAIPRTVSSETLDPSAIEELDDDDVKPTASGSVKLAQLTRAIEDALDKADGTPVAAAAKSESKRAAAVIIDDGNGPEDV